jgi:hypothetical protein
MHYLHTGVLVLVQVTLCHNIGVYMATGLVLFYALLLHQLYATEKYIMWYGKATLSKFAKIAEK